MPHISEKSWDEMLALILDQANILQALHEIHQPITDAIVPDSATVCKECSQPAMGYFADFPCNTMKAMYPEEET